MSADVPLPKQIVVHGFLFNRGEKMSKSVGNVIDPIALADHYGVDALRYFFLREVPFGQDGNYSHEAIVQRINADLANDLGNLAQRSLSMIAKNCGGRVPEQGELLAADIDILSKAYDALDRRPRRDARFRAASGARRKSGRWSPTPTAISPRRSRGSSARPIRRGATPCCLRRSKFCAWWGFCASPSSRRRRENCSTFLRCAPTSAISPYATPEHRLFAGADLPAPAPIFPRYVEPEAAKTC